MPIPPPPPPPPPGGPPPPPTLSQANTSPPKLSREEAKGRGALLSDICKGTKLKKVSVVNDRSAPLLDSKTQTPKSQTPPTEHPYIRLYQYLHQQQSQPKQQGAPSEEQKKTAGEKSSEKPKGGGAATGGANGSGAASPSGSVPPIGGLFTGGVPKLRPVGDGSSGRSPSTRAAAPRPPSHRHDDAESPSPQASSPMETCRSQRPSLPNLSSSPSPSNGPTGGSGEAAPELPQRHNSLSSKRTAPSPGGHTPTRGPAPPPPPSSPTPSQQGANRPPPPVREAPGRGAAPPVPVQSSSSRAGCREAPPPPPYRTHGSPSLSSEPPTRGKPPPPPSIPRSFVDDFESKYSFHPLDDFPPPDEYRHFAKIYPSKANRVMRGAPPLPPVGR
ncbi:WAS/WASL-interacting protein family member 2-like [Seriola lalandi dorsalis]|uniref:WAS/WASL-interacting protein family member 2-like n=1 Tax=Seriola lalandi dorsalis TaxID=1841481 RepID=UPI000C6F4F7D|nr:WAS/WASL-interacting protein family member 2-like [Seriola lalandi dorsalis]